MIAYRPFRNSDPPQLAEVWRSQPPGAALLQPMSAAVLELHVLGKPYFDRHGLIVATDDDRVVGFAHAGFGANEQGTALEFAFGVTCVVLVAPHAQRLEIAQQLIVQCEAYLRSRGAQVLYGGGVYPLNPFYTGLYGGSELPGILERDELAVSAFRNSGYREIDRVTLLRRTLDRQPLPVDRKQQAVRRSCSMEIIDEPPYENWWQACTHSHAARTQFALQTRALEPRCSVTYADLPALPGQSIHGIALVQLETTDASRRQGMASFLVAESLKHWREQGLAAVEVQTMQRNSAALALYRKLGFTEIDHGLVFRKE